MAIRRAHARWDGAIKDGTGQVDFGDGAFKSAYTFKSRIEDDKGTNPEELLGAAHASCFAMALSHVLRSAGFKPDHIDTTAHVTILPREGGFRIMKSHLDCEAVVPDIDRATFVRHAETAKAACPISQALGGTTITLDATLVR